MLRIAFLILLATPAFAEAPLTGAEFEARVQGKTLSYSGAGAQPYGVERYLPGRRVIWSFLDGQCQDGKWYEQAGSICFLYDAEPTPQCWKIFDEDGALRAIYMNDPGTSILYQIGDGAASLVCGDYGV